MQTYTNTTIFQWQRDAIEDLYSDVPDIGVDDVVRIVVSNHIAAMKSDQIRRENKTKMRKSK